MASVDELWLTDFGEPAFHRPALVVGPPDYFGASFPFVMLVPLTTTDRGLSLHVEIEASSTTGLDQVSFAQCELLRSVNQKRLIHRIGHVDAAATADVSSILSTLLNV